MAMNDKKEQSFFKKYKEGLIVNALAIPLIVFFIIRDEIKYDAEEDILDSYPVLALKDSVINEEVMGIYTAEHIRIYIFNAYVKLNRSGKMAIFVDDDDCDMSLSGAIKVGSRIYKAKNSKDVFITNISNRDTVTYHFLLTKSMSEIEAEEALEAQKAGNNKKPDK